MASNSFGKIFKVTTWGESHGRALGGVIDGCPAGVEIDPLEIQSRLAKRSPGNTPYTSTRKESDQIEILSGVLGGKSTGHPIAFLIPNENGQSKDYETSRHILKPGHAHFTYLQKYGVFDHDGGGRASGRETAIRVAAGAIAKKILDLEGIQITAFLQQIGPIALPRIPDDLFEKMADSELFCPDPSTEQKMKDLIKKTKTSGDSIGGIVGVRALGIPPGLGDPVYQKLEAQLAKAMMGIPASKGFEIGSGFAAGRMYGSEHNDLFELDEENKIRTTSNNSGGVLGGISNGMPLDFRVAFKPTSSIFLPQRSLSTGGKTAIFEMPPNARHDPCIAIRAVPVVEAMTLLTLTDALLSQRCARI